MKVRAVGSWGAHSLITALIISPLGAIAQTTINVGWCAPSLNAAAAPFAVATKMGWFAEGGLRVVAVPLQGSTECVKAVATRDVPYSIPSIEQVAAIQRFGTKGRTYYTAYQGFGFGIAVPAESPIKSFADLRGKTIGVNSMDSAGVIVARALAASAGLNPNTDIRIVVVGQAGQTAALIRRGEVDALSQFETQSAAVEQAGVKLRRLDNSAIAGFPSNGFFALDDRLKDRRAEAVALGRGYAMGTLFAMNNPEAAVRMMYEVYPQTKPTGKDEATAIGDDVKIIDIRTNTQWKLEFGGVKRWGESNLRNYNNYIDFLVKWKIVPEKIQADVLVTNELIADINKFDAAAVIARAKAYKP